MEVKRPKILVYWNVARVDHHFLDAVVHLNNQFDVTFIGHNKFKNRIEFEDVNPNDYDFLLAYDTGAQTFNLENTKYDKRLDDIKGIPRILRTVDTHLRPSEHTEISKNFDLALFSSPSHEKYLSCPSKWLPMHIDTEMYSIAKGQVYNHRKFEKAIGKEYYPTNFVFEQSIDRYIDVSFLIKFLDVRTGTAKHIFQELPRLYEKCIMLKAFNYAAVYIHARTKVSLHLKCDKFIDNYITWRPLDAMSCGALPLIERGPDDSWQRMFEAVDVNEYRLFDRENAIESIKQAHSDYEYSDALPLAAKKFDIRLEATRLVDMVLNEQREWHEIQSVGESSD